MSIDYRLFCSVHVGVGFENKPDKEDFDFGPLLTVSTGLISERVSESEHKWDREREREKKREKDREKDRECMCVSVCVCVWKSLVMKPTWDRYNGYITTKEEKNRKWNLVKWFSSIPRLSFVYRSSLTYNWRE